MIFVKIIKNSYHIMDSYHISITLVKVLGAGWWVEATMQTSQSPLKSVSSIFP